MAEVLLQVGAGVDCLNSLDESPLTMQLRFGLVDGARFLLERGGQPKSWAIRTSPIRYHGFPHRIVT